MELNDYRALLEALLQKHYGIGVNDTFLSDEGVLGIYLSDEIHAFEAANEVASDVDLVRIDLPGDYGVPSQRALTLEDERRAYLPRPSNPTAAPRGPGMM